MNTCRTSLRIKYWRLWKNDLENDAIDKDDEIDSIEVDVQQEFGLTVNIVNLAYETQQCFVLQRVLDPHLRA